MKASDISDAICAMELGYEHIKTHVPPGTEGKGELCAKLFCSAARLRAELSAIDIEIKTDK